MTDSTTTNGWLKKSNFPDDNVDETEAHLSCKMELARTHSLRLLNNWVKEYNQWFPGNLNDVIDSLSRNFHLNDDQLTQLLTSAVPSQLPPCFTIAPLPQEIVSFLSVWLTRMPATPSSRETQKRSRMHLGPDGPSSLNQLGLGGVPSSTPSTPTTQPQSSHVMPTLSIKPSILHHLSNSWILAQSKMP